MKNFRDDIQFIFNKLKNKDRFAFSKYADGEFEILINNKITNCDNWTFDPTVHSKYRNELLDSFKFKDSGYYVGISCPCCVKQEDVAWMRENVGGNDENLTWANIFVNGNYPFYLENFIPEYSNHDIVLVANENAKIHNLPFKIEEHIKVTGTAFIDNFDLVQTLPNKDYKDKLFLFCAGPLGNMLAAKLWKYNKNNTYLDIGSTLNGWLTIPNRGYLRGSVTINRNCIW